MAKVHEEIERCAKRHSEVARAYECGGNAIGAAELRRVENLLWSLAKGEAWTTVLPAPAIAANDRSLGGSAWSPHEPSHAFSGGGADGRNPDRCGLCGELRERCKGSK
jgi:hypothetical protein